MDIDEEMRPKIALSVGAVILLVIVFLVIGVTFGGSGLSAAGGLALIGALVGFVLLMGLVGIYLDKQE